MRNYGRQPTTNTNVKADHPLAGPNTAYQVEVPHNLGRHHQTVQSRLCEVEAGDVQDRFPLGSRLAKVINDANHIERKPIGLRPHVDGRDGQLFVDEPGKPHLVLF